MTSAAQERLVEVETVGASASLTGLGGAVVYMLVVVTLSHGEPIAPLRVVRASGRARLIVSWATQARV